MNMLITCPSFYYRDSKEITETAQQLLLADMF
jgi:hypothetical protein